MKKAIHLVLQAHDTTPENTYIGPTTKQQCSTNSKEYLIQSPPPKNEKRPTTPGELEYLPRTYCGGLQVCVANVLLISC
jgi:hypothetical protein